MSQTAASSTSGTASIAFRCVPPIPFRPTTAMRSGSMEVLVLVPAGDTELVRVGLRLGGHHQGNGDERADDAGDEPNQADQREDKGSHGEHEDVAPEHLPG